jgi:hypothetical protein
MEKVLLFEEFVDKSITESSRISLEALNAIDNYDEAESFLNGLIDRDLRALAEIILSKPKVKKMGPSGLIKHLLDYWSEEIKD